MTFNPETRPDTVISTHNLTKRFGSLAAVDNVSIEVEADGIYGLLGRNGAGKTTLMQMITAHTRPTSGTLEVLGETPFERQHIVQQMCFVREGQQYPENFQIRNALTAASWFYENWDAALAERLMDEFDLPRKRSIKKLSRGMHSAVGIIIGLASHAPITIFDEPYLGLDAVARQMFYDNLLADYAENPRTVILSTHLIDEVANLLSHVFVIDHGKIIIDSASEDLRGTAVAVTGKAAAIDKFTAPYEVVHRQQLGSFATASIKTQFDATERALAASLGLEIEPLSMQQIVVNATTSAHPATSAVPEPSTPGA